MNSDQFEKQLSGQPLRQPPEDWRKEILATAAENARNHSDPLSEPSISWWRTLFWPAPRAWAGVATVWAVILFLRSSTEEPCIGTITPQASVPRQVEYAMHERQRLFAELLSELDTNAVAGPSRKFVPGPRSDAKPKMLCA